MIWDIVVVPNPSNTYTEHTRLARFYKTHFDILMNDYDVLLYLDSRIGIVGSISDYYKNLGELDAVFLKHPTTASIREHYVVLLKSNYESIEMINTIKARYAAHGYTYDNGLIASGVLLFRNNSRMRKFFCEWWEEIRNYSHRDQLSANFVLFLNPDIQYATLPCTGYSSITIPGKQTQYFCLSPRKHKRMTTETSNAPQ
jgi:hypothetical protein